MDFILKHDRATLTEMPKVKSKTREKDKDKEKGKEREQCGATIEKDINSPDAQNTPEKKEPVTKRLKKKLQEVSQENQSLAKAIEDKNFEISDLKRSVQSLNDVLNSVPIDELRCNSSIASTKLIELSKKNRTLRAELETTKNRVSKKELQILKLERELKLVEDKFHLDIEEPRKAAPSSIDDLQAKLSAMQQKLFESRNKNLELQNQLKLAQKCIQQEVGESFNLNILAGQPPNSNWRGRAQQILHLQQKVHELRERLDVCENSTAAGRVSSYGNDGTTAAVEMPTAKPETKNSKHQDHGAANNSQGALLSSPSNTSFDRFSPGVRKTEILHRAKVEALEKEISSLKAQLEDQRGKILALKVRNKTLNEDVAKYKVKTSSLEEQTDFNGINLASMNDKINTQKYKYENLLEEMSRQIADGKRKREEIEFREEEARIKLENAEELLDQKNDFINELQEKIRKLATDLKAVCGGFLFSCRELRKEEFIAILDSLEAEKNLLIKHNNNLNDRTEQERIKNETLMEQAAKHKIRCSRLEAKIRELEKDIEMQTERKKRTQRIAEYVNSVSSQHSFSNSVGSFVFENSSLCSVNSTPVEEMTNTQLADMKNQLEFATEKITMLEEKIAHLAEEKQNDAKTFEDIIISSKSIILDTIMSHKTSSSNSHVEHGNDKDALQFQ